MKRSAFAVAALAAGLSAGTANADVVLNFTSQTWAGFQFTDVSSIPGLVGTLTAVSVNATLENSVNDTWADDLTIYIDPAPLSFGGLVQAGGFSSLGAAERYFWANGGSPLPGTIVNDSYTLLAPITFVGGVTDPIVWVGNGYGAQGTSGTWTATVTLVGVNFVPTPGAAALLGLGGLIAARRRRA